jgi:hypothetical protein
MYPTASAPQYAFGPSLAPVSMPGMAGGGLAALANQYRRGGGVRYFEEGGDAATGGADSSTEGGAGAAFGGDTSSPGGADSSTEGGAGAAFGGPSETQGMAQTEMGNQAVTDALAEAALAGPLGEQIGIEAQQAEQTEADENAAALGAQANAIAAEIAAQAEEDAKNAEMAAVMSGQVAGFPGPSQATPGFGISFQNPFTTDISKAFGIFSPVATVTTPFGKANFSPMDFAAPAIGKGAQAVNSAVNIGSQLGFAEGGLAAAQQTQSKGRGQDTMLVHMTPGEVKGLQALAMSQGGSLTINPQTGLPEAGFLSAILPMVAGFALGPAGFGLMSSLGAGATVGALTGVATGSLKKGLMAGLGAYGGAGIGEGLIGAGNVTAPVTTGAEAGLTSAADMAASNLPPELFNSPITTSTSGIDPGLLEGTGLTPKSPYFKMAQSNIDPGLLEGMGGTPGMTAQQVATAPVLNPTPAVPTSPNVGFGRAGEGFTNMFDTGQVGTDARSAFMKATPTGSLTAAGTTVASALTPEPAPLEKSKTFIRPYSLEVENLSGQDPYTSGDTRERRQVRYAYKPEAIYEAAQGGTVDPNYNAEVYQNGGFSDSYNEGGLSALAKRRKSLTGDKRYKFAQDRRDSSMEASIEQNFAKGGLPPRFLQGAGDGMSDSIKARIGGVQEARLADGEFVVPADVVSHLGNGSSKAGAKKLYAMMDKIRKARTGRTRQAPEVNPNKYMPA